MTYFILGGVFVLILVFFGVAIYLYKTTEMPGQDDIRVDTGGHSPPVRMSPASNSEKVIIKYNWPFAK